MHKFKSAVVGDLLKALGDFAQYRFVQLLPSPTGRIKLIDRAQEVIGIARDRFRDEFVFARSQPLRGHRQQEPQMLAQRDIAGVRQQAFAQLRWGKESQSKDRNALGEKFAPQKISEAAGRGHDRAWSGGERRPRDGFKPRQEHVFPRAQK